jgi:hypothetical protein
MSHLHCKQHEKRVMVIESPKTPSGMAVIHRQDGQHCNSHFLQIGTSRFTFTTVNKDMPIMAWNDNPQDNRVARQLLMRIFGEQ